MSENEWRIVTKADKKRVMRRHRGANYENRHVVMHSSGTTSTPVENPEFLMKALLRCKELLVPTSYFQTLLQSLRDVPRDGVAIRQIVCYGIGNFSQTSLSFFSASLWQLACVLCLRDAVLEAEEEAPLNDLIPIVYYDPCSTRFENSFLTTQLQKVMVLYVNEQGNRAVQGVPTLFFMPHCPSTLYENVLWANWDEFRGQRTPIFYFIGNSLRNHCESSRMTQSSNMGNDCLCMRAIFSRVRETRLDGVPAKARNDKNDLPGNFVGAFNDTYFVSVSSNDDAPDWPERPYDILQPLLEDVALHR